MGREGGFEPPSPGRSPGALPSLCYPRTSNITPEKAFVTGKCQQLQMRIAQTRCENHEYGSKSLGQRDSLASKAECKAGNDDRRNSVHRQTALCYGRPPGIGPGAAL